MALPGVTNNFGDGGLGLIEPATSEYYKIGTSSKGPVNTVYVANDPGQTIATLGAGPLVTSGCYSLEVAGGPVNLIRVSASNAGTNGTVTLTGTGVTPGAAPSLTPLDDYDVKVKITRSGVVGTSAFQVSFDGGDNYSVEFATAASVSAFAGDTGLNITFAAGTYVKDDVYSWTSVGPTYSSTDLATALDVIKNRFTGAFKFIHVVGTVGGANDAAKVTNLAALLAAVDAKMASFELAGKFTQTIVEAPEVSVLSTLDVASINNFASKRVGAAYGYVEMINNAFKRQEKRHGATVYAARKAKVPLHISAGHVGQGSLPGVVGLYHDESLTPGPDALRFITLRTMNNKRGYFITNDRLMAPAGSDFTYAENRSVLDEAARLANEVLANYINGPVFVDAKGLVDEAQAKEIQKRVEKAIDAGLRANVGGPSISGRTVVVVRDNNILSTRTLQVRLRIIPVATSQFVALDIALENPANNINLAA